MVAPTPPGSFCFARSIEQAVPFESLTTPIPAQAFKHANKHTTASERFIYYLTIAETGFEIIELLVLTVIVL